VARRQVARARFHVAQLPLPNLVRILQILSSTVLFGYLSQVGADINDFLDSLINSVSARSLPWHQFTNKSAIFGKTLLKMRCGADIGSHLLIITVLITSTFV